MLPTRIISNPKQGFERVWIHVGAGTEKSQAAATANEARSKSKRMRQSVRRVCPHISRIGLFAQKRRQKQLEQTTRYFSSKSLFAKALSNHHPHHGALGYGCWETRKPTVTKQTRQLYFPNRSVSSSSSSSPLLKGLNDTQCRAVTQPLKAVTRIVAGPGAGKTRVLTCRIAHLLQQTESDRILAVTFTKKAANEMQERLEGLLDDEQRRKGKNNSSGLNRITVGTFHSICAKILRKYGHLLSELPTVKDRLIGSDNPAALDKTFSIAGQLEQMRIIIDLMKEEKEKDSLDLKWKKEKDSRKLISILNLFPKIRLIKEGELTLERKEPTLEEEEPTLEEEEELALEEEEPTLQSEKRSCNICNSSIFYDKGCINPTCLMARKMYPRYQTHLYSCNSLDFEELLFLTRELLQTHDEIRDHLRKKLFNHILVDEFQDTSKVQFDLVKLWTHKSLLIVGDADQSIYSWRGALAESMQNFEQEFPNVDTFYLMENYRSTPHIVQAAQKVINNGEESSSSPGETTKNAQHQYRRQDMKPMRREEGCDVNVEACEDSKEEASYVVKKIVEMISSKELHRYVKIDEGALPTVAVLFRTNAQSRAIERACIDQDLPYVLTGSTMSFYDRSEIKDCLCFLQWIHDGHDEQAMKRAFKTPPRGIGPKAIDDFEGYHRQVEEFYNLYNTMHNDNGPPSPTLLDTLIALADEEGPSASFLEGAPRPEETISKRALNNLLPFAQEMCEIRKEAYKKTLPALVSYIVEKLDLKSFFEKVSKSDQESIDRWENVQELIRYSAEYSEEGAAIQQSTHGADAHDDYTLDRFDSPLVKFLDDVLLATEVAREKGKEDKDDDGETIKVKLMTVHASKGMEFNAVFVIGNEEGTFPHQRATLEESSSVEEERRLCYVAMTRAKDFLTMTWRQTYLLFDGKKVNNRRSHFLNPFFPTEEVEPSNQDVQPPKVASNSFLESFI